MDQLRPSLSGIFTSLERRFFSWSQKLNEIPKLWRERKRQGERERKRQGERETETEMRNTLIEKKCWRIFLLHLQKMRRRR